MDRPGHLGRRFELIDRYLGTRMGVDLAGVRPGIVEVVETPLRQQREQSFGYVRSLWWLWLEDGRSAVSVPPGVGKPVRARLNRVKDAAQVFDAALTAELRTAVDQALGRDGLARSDRVFTDVNFACDAHLLRRHHDGDCRRLTDESIPPANGLALPTHCFPDGIVYGVVADGVIASVAYAHRTGLMEDQVADLGVETAPAYRRRGYARKAVSAVVADVTARGGQACYYCSPDNAASIVTAASAGFLPYARSLILGSPLGHLNERSSA